MAIQITREEYEKKFGVKPDTSAGKIVKPPSRGQEFLGDIRGIFTGAKEAFRTQQEKSATTREAFRTGEQGAFSTGFQLRGQQFGLISNIIGEGIMGLGKAIIPQKIEEAIGRGVTKVGTKIAEKPGAQNIMAKYENLKQTNPELARNIDAALGIGSLALDVSGIGLGAKGVTIGAKQAFKGGIRAGEAALQAGKGAIKATGEVAKDIIPPASKYSSSLITKALNLQPGDLRNIKNSTTHDVGTFLNREKLVKNTVEDTKKATQEFFEKNHQAVRTEIGKVKKIYDKNQIPAFKEGLTAIEKQIKDVPGLHKAELEVGQLLKKDKMSLNDIQKVKELLDEHFTLYKQTGDVGQGEAKQGLANLRSELKTFIEEETKKATGADIKDLNNKVSASRSIIDAIETRAPRGLTRANFTFTDVGLLGLGGFTPVGPVILILKKVAESPAIRLRLAKLLDKMSEARKAKIKAELQAGKVPNEIREAVKR